VENRRVVGDCMTVVRVALAQTNVVLGNKQANMDRVGEVVFEASGKGAKVVCLPEMFSTGFDKKVLSGLAEPVPGPTTEALRLLASKHGLMIAGSIVEKGTEGLYNTAVLVGGNGVVLKHRKVHPFLEEAELVGGGSAYETKETPLGKCGLLVCYDAAFPEAARALALDGAQIIFLPSNWMEPFLGQWRLATSARALDNQVWVVAVNRVGTDGTYNYFGHSRVVDPYGNVVVECGSGEEIAVADMELGKAGEFKKIVDFMGDRKPATYGAVVRENQPHK